jgi:hypothetical protein
MSPVNFYLALAMVLMIGFVAGYFVARMTQSSGQGKQAPEVRRSEHLGRVASSHPAHVATIDN